MRRRASLALAVAIQCVCGLLTLGTGRRVRISDFMRLGAVYYLTVLFGEIVSPATDYFAMLLVFYVLIAWLDELEAGEKNAAPYALLSLLLVFTVTVKLSAAVLLAAGAEAGGDAAGRERRWKQIGLYLGLGLLICLPWMIRGVLISGWLFYPFTFVDLFSVDWKMEKGYADSDAKEIQVFARGLYDVNLYDTPFSGWARELVSRLRGMEKLWIVSCACARQPDAASLVICAAGHGNGERKGSGYSGRDWLLYGAVLLVGYLFWQFSAPLVRYGYAYVIALPAGTAGFWFCFLTASGGEKAGMRNARMGGTAGGGRERGTGAARSVFLLCAGVFLLYKAADLSAAVRASAGQPYYIRQQGYGEYEAVAWELDGITVYVPADGGKIGYDKFPSAPRVQDIELREKGESARGLPAVGRLIRPGEFCHQRKERRNHDESIWCGNGGRRRDQAVAAFHQAKAQAVSESFGKGDAGERGPGPAVRCGAGNLHRHERRAGAGDAFPDRGTGAGGSYPQGACGKKYGGLHRIRGDDHPEKIRGRHHVRGPFRSLYPG